MRILWDFRLFSYGYANRGVGTYTRQLAEAILKENKKDIILIWADKESIPEHMKSWPVKWIPYKPNSWKNDLPTIPYLIYKHAIDIIHYWITLGPIHTIGMGIMHPCKAIATVYDLGVELWDEIPFAASKRNTWYWKTQKRLIQQCSTAICISKATQSDLKRVIKKQYFNTEVVYMPLPHEDKANNEKRKSYFITLGGSIHKNLKRVITAFEKVKADNKECELIILGDIAKKDEVPDKIPAYIRFDDMSNYAHHRQYASGLIFCSLHEGLGIPAIEAMQYHCPLLLSDIPSLREICNNYAYFVNPLEINDIAKGIDDIINNQNHWVEKSKEGKKKYQKMSKNSGKEIVKLYQSYK